MGSFVGVNEAYSFLEFSSEYYVPAYWESDAWAAAAKKQARAWLAKQRGS